MKPAILALVEADSFSIARSDGAKQQISMLERAVPNLTEYTWKIGITKCNENFSKINWETILNFFQKHETEYMFTHVININERMFSKSNSMRDDLIGQLISQTSHPRPTKSDSDY